MAKSKKQKRGTELSPDVKRIITKTWPLGQDVREYPFKNEGALIRLSFEQQDLFRRTPTVGFPFSLSSLKVYLAQKLNIQSPLNYSIFDIIAALTLTESIEQKQGDTGGGKADIKPKRKRKTPPLPEKDITVLELLENLPERKGLTGKQILQMLDEKKIYIDQSTLTKGIIPRLRRNGYRIKNKRNGAGYYIEK